MGNSMNLPLGVVFPGAARERQKKNIRTHDRTLRPPAASEKIRKNGGTLRGRCQKKNP